MITFMPSHDEIEAKIANEAAFIKKEGFARAFVYPGQGSSALTERGLALVNRLLNLGVDMRTIAGGSGQNTSVFLKPNDLSSLDPQLQDEIKNVFASTVKEGFYGSSNAGISVSLSTP